jgi:ring-1,2-phenylacetyl-CoA epoxidase subunit PaaC
MAAPVDYLLHLADNALILGQRNAEWCGHGPVLEEDLSIANNSLDLIGQARLLYQYVAQIQGSDATEDSLAYFRGVPDFKNFTLLELPHHGPLAATASGDRDYATTITRNFLYSAFMLLVWEALQLSKDSTLAAIAAKSLKEVKYHFRHSRDWMVRFGDGTDESHARAQAALDHLMPYTEEFWVVTAYEAAASTNRTGVDPQTLRDDWLSLIDAAIAESSLKRPAVAQGYIAQGKQGLHSEHLGFVLAEMQSLARAHPGATW